jgi:flagellar biosynthesis protein FlhB
MSEKTEEATPRRLRKARAEGDSGASAFAAQAVGFLVAAAAGPWAVRALAGRASADLVLALEEAPERAAKAVAGGDASIFGAERVAGAMGAIAVPLLAATALAVIVAGAVQTGGLVVAKRIAPRLDRLNVVEGFKALVSSARLFAVLRAIVGASAVAWLVERCAVAHIGDVARVEGRLAYVPRVVEAALVPVVVGAAVVGLALGALDLLVVRLAWQKRLRMSKDEVRREHKEAEGDPQMKAARERAHREVVNQATLASVKTASVVVVNPTHLASALRYDQAGGDSAPVVVAKGDGELARRIVEAARDFGVPVVRDVPLARALAELEEGDAIPEALYEAVAEILHEVWQEGEREREKMEKGP